MLHGARTARGALGKCLLLAIHGDREPEATRSSSPQCYLILPNYRIVSTTGLSQPAWTSWQTIMAVVVTIR